MDSAALREEVTDLDEYMFVVRARKTSEQVFYVDIKSDGLRDVLRITPARRARALSRRGQHRCMNPLHLLRTESKKGTA